MNINKFLDKKYEKLTFKEIVASPVDAIAGISEGDAKLLKKAFNVKTVQDLAKLKYIKWAQAICTLVDRGFQMNTNKSIDKKYEKLTLKELAAAPVDAIAGISAEDVKLLKETFNVKTISELAELPSSVTLAKAICTLAEGEL